MLYRTQQIGDSSLPTYPALSIASCPNGKEVLTSGQDFQLRKWDLKEGKCTRNWNANGPLNAILVVPSGKMAMMAAVQGIVPWNLETWDLCSPNTFWSFCWISDLAYSGISEEILGAGENCLIYRWDSKNGNQKEPFKGHQFMVTTVSMDLEGQYAFSGDLGGELFYWNLLSGTCLKTWKGHDQKISTADLSRDGLLGVTGSQDGCILLWDVKTGNRIKVLKRDGYWVEKVKFCKNDQLIVSAGDEGLSLWDVKTGKLIARNETERIVDFCFSPDETCVIGIVKSNKLLMWSIG